MEFKIIDILNADATQIKKIFEDLDKNGLLKKNLPELVALKGVDNSKASLHKDNFIHTLEVIENTYYATTNPMIRLVSILHDIGKAKTKRWVEGNGWSFHNHEIEGGKMILRIFKRLNIPTKYFDYVHKLVVYHGHPKALTIDVSESALRRFGKDVGNDLEDLILFCKCDITSKKLDKKERQIKAYEKVYTETLRVREKDKLAEWRCPIDGNHIMEYFGTKEGRKIGIIKNKIIDAIKSGEIADSYEEAFEYMKKIKE
jgi:poly(A) polymerase